MSVSYPAKYLPLHLLFDCTEKDRYIMRVLPPAPLPNSYRDTIYPFRQPRPPQLVASLINDIERAVQSEGGSDRAEGERVFKAIQQHGDYINRLVVNIHEEVRQCLRESLSINLFEQRLGLLIRLHFGHGTEKLSKLIWETWQHKDTRGHDFLIRRPWVSLVRFVPGPASWREINGDAGRPLRLLVVTSSYKTTDLPDDELDASTKKEWESLHCSLGTLVEQGIVEIKNLPNPTPEQLKEALTDADIYHHFGHGGVTRTGRAFVMLRDPNSRVGFGMQAYWDSLSECFDPSSARHLKLVVLNACELQKAGLGTSLARLGVPAVIVMQAAISTQVIVEGGFTQEFYMRLAAGDPVHVAFSKARASIALRFNNPVESFIPMLILSTTEDVIFRHRSAAKAQSLAQEHELRTDPLKALWDEAHGLEQRGDLEGALRLFGEISARQADYPDVEGRLAALRVAVERRARADELVPQVRAAVQKRDFGWLRDVLKDAAPLALEPAMIDALAYASTEIAQAFEQLRVTGQYVEAWQACEVLRALSPLLPKERRAEVDCSAIEEHRRKELRKREAALGELSQRYKWQQVVEQAQQYLSADPNNDRVAGLLAKAQEMQRLDSRVLIQGVTSQAPPVTEGQYGELKKLMNKGEWARLEAEAGRLLREVPEQHQSELKWFRLYASAQLHRKKGDWAALKSDSRELLRLDSNDSRARALLDEGLKQEAARLAGSRRWEEAAANYRELIQLDPTRAEHWQALNGVRLRHADEAKRQYNWAKVRELTQQILDSPQPTDRKGKNIVAQARQRRDEAEEAYQLLKRIKLL